jgi:hypothetical protein
MRECDVELEECRGTFGLCLKVRRHIAIVHDPPVCLAKYVVGESIGKRPLTAIIREGCPLDCGRGAVAALRKLKGEPAASTMTSGSCLVLAVASRQSMVVTDASRTRSLAVLK